MNGARIAQLFREIANEIDGGPATQPGGSVGGSTGTGTGTGTGRPPPSGNLDDAPSDMTVIRLPWGGDDSTPDHRTWTVNRGGIGQNGVAMSFRTGPMETDGRGIANVSFTVADGGKPAPSQMVISHEPGDFDNPVTIPSSFGPLKCESIGGGDTRTINFAIGPNPPAYTPALQPNTDYWLNFRYTGEHGGNGRFYFNKPGYLA